MIPGATRIEHLVARQAADRPEQIALRFADRRWTFAALYAEMNRRAAMFVRHGARSGDVVATSLPVSDDVVLAFLACCRADLAFFHLSPGMTVAEAAPLLARARPRFMLTAHGEPHPASPATDALPLDLPGAINNANLPPQSSNAEAVAMIQTTSGTTGTMPKLIGASHRALAWHGFRRSWWTQPGDVLYRPTALYFPVRDVCELLATGTTLALSQATHPAQIEAEMAACSATSIFAVPGILRLLGEQRQPPLPELRLRLLTYSAAPLAPAAREATARRYGVPVLMAYGSAEGGSLTRTLDEQVPTGSIGTPYDGVRLRIVGENGDDVPEGETGELIASSPGMMVGYLHDPAATAAVIRDGWLWTGDLARRDAAGLYYLAGRRTLRINVGGAKVAPEEVEAVLEQYPGVREAVVVGMPDAVHGEVVRAIIVPRETPPTTAALRRFCRERLAAYKVPRHWEFRDELPRSSLGKVLRRQL